MQNITLSRRMYAQYVGTVRGNEKTTRKQAHRKMTRNAALAISSPHFNDKGKVIGTHYRYGCLHFIVANNGGVVWLRNHSVAPKGWKRDNVRYIELNKELGIQDDITPQGLAERDTYYARGKEREVVFA